MTNVPKTTLSFWTPVVWQMREQDPFYQKITSAVVSLADAFFRVTGTTAYVKECQGDTIYVKLERGSFHIIDVILKIAFTFFFPIATVALFGIKCLVHTYYRTYYRFEMHQDTATEMIEQLEMKEGRFIHRSLSQSTLNSEDSFSEDSLTFESITQEPSIEQKTRALDQYLEDVTNSLFTSPPRSSPTLKGNSKDYLQSKPRTPTPPPFEATHDRSLDARIENLMQCVSSTTVVIEEGTGPAALQRSNAPKQDEATSAIYQDPLIIHL